MEKILATSSGRYKVLKLVQYVAKLLLLLSSHKRIRLSLHQRHGLLRLVGQCSLQRRILQLGNLYRPLKALVSPATYASVPHVREGSSEGKSVSYHKVERIDSYNKVKRIDWYGICLQVSGLVEDVSEDIFTLAQLRWLPARFTGVAVYADRAWLASLLLDLRAWSMLKQDLMTRKRLARLRDQRPKSELASGGGGMRALREEEWWLDLDGIRIMCDAGQAWCDVFEVQVFDGFVVGCALTSAILGLYRFVAMPSS